MAPLVLVFLLALTAPAAAAVQLDTATTPESVAWREQDAVDYKLKLATGGRAEKLEVYFEEAGGWPDVGPFSFVGSPIRLGEPRLEGPGQIVPGPTVVPSTDALVGDLCYRNWSGTVTRSVMLELPGNAQSTLVVPGQLGPQAPPWEGSNLGAQFSVYGREESSFDSASLIAPGPRNDGRTGVKIRFSTEPPSDTGQRYSPGATVPAGEPVKIRGRLDPPLANQRVVLRYATEADRTERKLAKLHTSPRGRFILPSWVPPGPGTYWIHVRYPQQDDTYARDRSCERTLTVE